MLRLGCIEREPYLVTAVALGAVLILIHTPGVVAQQPAN